MTRMVKAAGLGRDCFLRNLREAAGDVGIGLSSV